jgi:hypothetical protein
MADTISLLGGCKCGELRYVGTRPFPTACICHCRRCQKRTGRAFSMSAVIPADGLEIVAGKPLRMDRQLANGATNRSRICPGCYSGIYTRWEGRKTLNIRSGTLDGSSNIRPVAQIWTERAQPRAPVAHDILSCGEQPTDHAPLLAAWQASLQRQ